MKVRNQAAWVVAFVASQAFAKLPASYCVSGLGMSPEANILIHHFDEIAQVPHDSYQEHAMRARFEKIATENSLFFQSQPSQKGGGNLRVLTPGRGKYAGSKARPIAFAVHMDGVELMADEKADSKAHFAKGIEFDITDGWLHTKDYLSTNRADNGIGLAAVEMIMRGEFKDFPPAEILMTWGEEVGLLGVEEWNMPIEAEYLITLDGEDFRDADIGSMGAKMLDFSRDRLPTVAIGVEESALDVRLQGLLGGHSGGAIHLNRGNAVRFALQLLEKIAALSPATKVTSISAGSFTPEGKGIFTAIPKDFSFSLSVPNKDLEKVQALIAGFEGTIRAAVSEVTEKFELSANPGNAQVVGFSMATILGLAHPIISLPNEVLHKESGRLFPNDVRHCSNVAFMTLAPSDTRSLVLGIMPRSHVDSDLPSYQQNVEGILAPLAVSLEVKANYPAWTADLNNELALRLVKVVGPRKYNFIAAGGGIEPSVYVSKRPGLKAINLALTSVAKAHSAQESTHLGNLNQGLMDMRALVEELASGTP